MGLKKMTRREFMATTGTLALGASLLRLGGVFASVKEATSEVFFTRDISGSGVLNAFNRIKGKVSGKTGIKLHFGAEGNRNYLRPPMIRDLAQKLDAPLMDTNCLYVSKRRYTDSHIQLAKDHGFGFAPIDILDADGDKNIPVDMKHYKEVRAGAHIDNYDTIVVFSHLKGHMMTGFGGAIKNISMGIGSVAGKMALHASTIPITAPDKCIRCGSCVKQCPGSAITIEPLVIDPATCIGCGKCIGVCPVRAFSVPWGSTEKSVVMERLAEYSKGINDHTNMVYINVLANISSSCDCDKEAPLPFMKDVGILASTDMVAIEKASYDLVNRASGSEDTFLKACSVSGLHQIDYAAGLGLGTMQYDLTDMDKSTARTFQPRKKTA